MTAETDAQNKILESIRKLFSLKLTLPLGNPNLKLVHTNQFLFLDLPEEFELANMEALDKAWTSGYNRYSGYQSNRWYIEGVTITNNGDTATMDLDLNPYASPHLDYKEAYWGYIDAYDNAVNTNNNNNEGSGKKVKSVKSDNSSFKGGEGKTIDNLVKDIIGDETNILKKAKLIHKWLVKNIHYKYYLNSRTSSPASALSRGKGKGINCADTSRLTASMFRSAGIPCYVVHSTCHYYTVLKYNGKLYCSDATSRKSVFNEYWQAGHGGRCKGYRVKFKGKSSYGKKCGDNPCS